MFKIISRAIFTEKCNNFFKNCIVFVEFLFKGKLKQSQNENKAKNERIFPIIMHAWV